MIYAFIETEKANFPITYMCDYFNVSPQAFYDWCARVAGGPTQGEIDEAELVSQIRAIHAESDGTYGQPRMTPALHDKGYCVNHKRVERLMREHGIVGYSPKRRVITTVRADDADNVTDLVKRDFVKSQADIAWCGDIERHEALLNRVEVKGLHLSAVAAA
jgi:hypothetical protein